MHRTGPSSAKGYEPLDDYFGPSEDAVSEPTTGPRPPQRQSRASTDTGIPSPLGHAEMATGVDGAPTYAHRHTQTYAHSQTDTHTYTHRHTQTYTHSQTDTHTHTLTERVRDTDTCMM